MAKVNLRAQVTLCIANVLNNGQSLQEALPEALNNVADKDRAWLHEMTYGVLRQLPTLQFWLGQLLERPLKGKQKKLEFLIMLGFYQLAFSRVSQHAAVAETVEACSALGNRPMKGLVNAILRNFIRGDFQAKPIEETRIVAGMPKWLYKKIIQAYPENAENIFKAQKQKPPVWLRINQQKVDASTFKRALVENDIGFEEFEGKPWLIKLTSSLAIPLLPGFAEGWFAVQDAAAQQAALHLDAQPNDVILDACAAPGGKTAHILEMQPNLKDCVALDTDASRLQRMAENLARLGHAATIKTGDAATPETWSPYPQYDRILLDAPCSATGIIRRHPDIPWLRKAPDIEVLTELQANILKAMWSLLKPGGLLLYATCSILPEENKEQIKRFLESNQDAQLQCLAGGRENEVGLQILPGENDMDGFYYAKLIKSVATV